MQKCSTNGVKIASSMIGVVRSGQLYANKWNSTTNLHHTQKINSRWIKELNISCNTKKSHREKHRQENLRYSIQQYFHWYVPYNNGYKERINKLDHIRLKGFCTAKHQQSGKGTNCMGKHICQ